MYLLVIGTERPCSANLPNLHTNRTCHFDTSHPVNLVNFMPKIRHNYFHTNTFRTTVVCSLAFTLCVIRMSSVLYTIANKSQTYKITTYYLNRKIVTQNIGMIMSGIWHFGNMFRTRLRQREYLTKSSLSASFFSAQLSEKTKQRFAQGDS
jgi:hypothetical protein